MQLKQANSTIEKQVRDNKKMLEKKFQDHIDGLKKIFNEYRKKQTEILTSNQQLLDDRLEDVNKNISYHLEQYEEYNQLFDLDNVEDHDLVLMEDRVDDMHDNLVTSNPDTNLENLKIDVDIDEDIVLRVNQNLY